MVRVTLSVTFTMTLSLCGYEVYLITTPLLNEVLPIDELISYGILTFKCLATIVNQPNVFSLILGHFNLIKSPSTLKRLKRFLKF